VAKRKYTRKQLRQPDEFISFSMKAWGVVRDNAVRVIVMLVVAALIVAGVWTWTYFSDARAAKATGVLSKAFEIYNQTVVPMEALPPSEDGIPRFKTHKAKLEAAEKEFTQAVERSSGTLKGLALLMRAGVRYELGRYDKALEDYNQYLGHSGNKAFRFNAQEGVGYCHEARKEWDKALAAFRKLGGEGEQKWVAVYHEGRVLGRKGQKKEAADLLRQVISKAASKALQERAGDQLAQIVAK
jgi:tetratricopeptide (TPR) repeat protein